MPMNEINRLLLIINPISGTHSKRGLDKQLVAKLESLGFSVDVRFTGGPGDATLFASEAVSDRSYDGVLTCGGDGTVNEVAKAITGTGMPMGILPAGSGNGLARHLDLPIDPLAAIDIIGQRNLRKCDYGLVNGRPFFCTFGLGFDAVVSDRFARAQSRGKLTYIRSAIHEFLRYKPQSYSIIADGEAIVDDAMLVAVCNANQYGNNAFIAPEASITDGLLDLVVVRKMPKPAAVVMGMEMMAGTLSNSHNLIVRKVKNVHISRADEGPAHLDGEPLTHNDTEFDISCQSGALTLFTNGSKAPFRPFITPFMATMSDIGVTLRHIFR